MGKYEYKTYEIEIQTALFGSSHLSASAIEKLLNEYSEEGWDFQSSIQKSTDGYTRQVILVFRRKKL